MSRIALLQKHEVQGESVGRPERRYVLLWSEPEPSPAKLAEALSWLQLERGVLGMGQQDSKSLFFDVHDDADFAPVEADLRKILKNRFDIELELAWETTAS